MSTIPSPETTEHPVLIFDGTCILCDSFFKWVVKKDHKKKFRFATLQSEYAKQLLKNQSFDPAADTVILYHHGALSTYSSAALKTMVLIGGFTKAIGYLGFIFPKFIRDSVYRFIAKNRYKWFGTKSCLIPGPEWKGRFIN